jgi:hypothetical protein
MSALLESVIRPFQILPTPRRVPVAAASTSGRVTVTKAAIDQGGTGYQVDDTIILDGGTGTAAVLRVRSTDTSTGAGYNGAILSVTIDSPGNYTLFPSDPTTQRSTSGQGSGASFTLTSSAGGNQPVSVQKAEPASQGQGYAVDDRITIAGGTGSAVILRVSAIVAGPGKVTAVTIDEPGSYSVFPDSPASQATSTGNGSGATFSLTPSAGPNNAKIITWGAVGKMPSPVSDAIGISLCEEKYDETSRITEDVRITDPSGSGSYIVVRRTVKMQMKKSEEKNILKSDYTAYIDQAFDQFSSEVSSAFTPVDDTQTGKCNVISTYKNNQGTT